jgi:glutaredoxin 3
MVTVYSSPGCGYCHMAMQYLANKKVAYKERNIAEDREAMQFVSDTIGQLATPVIDVDGEIILGFDRPRIDMALRAKKLV